MAERALSRKGLKAISMASQPSAKAPRMKNACLDPDGFFPMVLVVAAPTRCVRSRELRLLFLFYCNNEQNIR